MASNDFYDSLAAGDVSRASDLGLFEKGVYGVGSAIIAGGTSLLNSTNYLISKPFGMWDEDKDKIDASSVVDSIFGSQASQYYKDNKTGLDLLGEIGASFIPGTLAIKGLRALQSSKLMMGGMAEAKAAVDAGSIGTQLSWGTFLRPTQYAERLTAQARESVLATAEWSVANATKNRAIAAYAYQGALEGVAFEYAAETFLNQSSMYDKDSLEKTLIWNPLLSASLGGIAGAIAGRYKVFASGGLTTAVNDVSSMLDRAILGTDMTTITKFEPEQIGLAKLRAEKQRAAIQEAMDSGKLTESQMQAAASVMAKLDKTNKSFLEHALSGSIDGSSNLRGRDLAPAVDRMTAAQAEGTFAGVAKLRNVTEEDAFLGAAVAPQTIVFATGTKGSPTFFKSAEFTPVVGSVEADDLVRGAVRIDAGTIIYNKDTAALATAAGIKPTVIIGENGAYHFPEGLNVAGVTFIGTPKNKKIAQSLLASDATTDIIMAAKNMSMVSGPLYPTLVELLGQDTLRSGKSVTMASGKVLDFAAPTSKNLASDANRIEAMIAQNENYLASEAIWIRLNKHAEDNPVPGRVDEKLFENNVAYAETQFLAAQRKGLGQLELYDPALRRSLSLSMNSAEQLIAGRKSALAEELFARGLSREEIESHLKIRLADDTIMDDIDQLVGIGVDKFQAARYVKAEVNLSKAEALLNNMLVSQRQLQETRGYQMTAQPIAQSLMAQHLGLDPARFVDKLDLDAFGKPAISITGNHAGIMTNSRASEMVKGAGGQAQLKDKAAHDKVTALDREKIAPTAAFVSDKESVHQMALVRSLYAQRLPGGNPMLFELGQGKAFVMPRQTYEAAMTFLRAIDQNKNRPQTLATLVQDLDDLTRSKGVLAVKPGVAAHLRALSDANHEVEMARRAGNGFFGRKSFPAEKDQIWFPTSDPAENPFALFVRTPGLQGEAAKFEVFLADRATFESKKAALIADTQDITNPMYRAKVLTTADIKREHVLRGEFEWNKDFISAQYDSAVSKQGKVMETAGFDQKYFNEITKSFMGRWKSFGDDMLHMMYPEYSLFQKMHVEEALQKTSTFGKAQTLTGKFDIDRTTTAETETTFSTMLDIMSNKSREDRTKLPGLVNRFTQAGYDRTMDAIKGALGKTASDPKFVERVLDSKELDEISKAAYEVGANVHASQMMVALTKANGTFNPQLTSVISKLNAVSNFFMIRMDAMASAVNAISSPITALPHFRQVINQAKAANGGKLPPQLAELLEVKVGDDFSTLSSGKLFAKVARTFFTEPAKVKETLDFLKVDVTNYQHAVAMVDLQAAAFAPDVTLSGIQRAVKGVASFVKENRIAKGLESVADHTEAFNQYVAGRSGYEIAKAAGLSENAAKLFSTGFAQQINNSVNFGARHSFYSGPAGMLVGLYQNYMRGMITRTLQFLDDGETKALVEMAGLQGAIFGARSYPLFDFYNRKLLGENNQRHADAYSAIYGLNGQLLGDFIAYGAGSSLLGMNVFTRGEQTPFSSTVLPMPWDSPAAKTLVNLAKLGGNLMESGVQALGGNGQQAKNNFLFALEHNDLNRPIGRMAAMLQGYSTSRQGTPVYDIWSPENRGLMGGELLPKELGAVATLVAGVAGTQPLTEAITKDVLYRMTAYQLRDKEARNELGKKLKILLGKDGELDEEAFAEANASYIKKGGTPQGFQQLYSKALMAGKADPIREVIRKDPNNNLYGYASIILGPQARMNPDPDAPAD